jgi:hypothetical protein
VSSSRIGDTETRAVVCGDTFGTATDRPDDGATSNSLRPSVRLMFTLYSMAVAARSGAMLARQLIVSVLPMPPVTETPMRKRTYDRRSADVKASATKMLCRGGAHVTSVT